MCPRDCRNDQVHSLLFLCFPMAWYALLWFLLTLNYLISISSNQKKVTLPPLYNCVRIGFHWCFRQERIDAQYNIKLLSFDIKKCIITWISFFFGTFQMSSHFATFTCFQIGLGLVMLMLSAYLFFCWQENLQKQQLMSLECTSQVKNFFWFEKTFLMYLLNYLVKHLNFIILILQFQNGLHIPFSMSTEQQLQPLPWIPTNESRHIVLPEDPNLLPHRWVVVQKYN